MARRRLLDEPVDHRHVDATPKGRNRAGVHHLATRKVKLPQDDGRRLGVGRHDVSETPWDGWGFEKEFDDPRRDRRGGAQKKRMKDMF